MSTAPGTDGLTERKNVLRRQAYDARNAQPNKDEVSRQAIERFVQLPEYQNARTVMWYIDCRSELRTRRRITGRPAVGQADCGPVLHRR